MTVPSTTTYSKRSFIVLSLEGLLVDVEVSTCVDQRFARLQNVRRAHRWHHVEHLVRQDRLGKSDKTL